MKSLNTGVNFLPSSISSVYAMAALSKICDLEFI